MGLLVDGIWHDQWYDTDRHEGEFVREQSRFHHWVTADGSPGPTGRGGFQAEAGRYHLYVSLACPWAHRTLIFRQLKGLAPLIGVSVVSPLMLDQGWSYDEHTGSSGDQVNGYRHHHQLYTATDPQYSGRVTVPVLWDTRTNRIVNNESAEIIRMFNCAFNDLTGNRDDYYPLALRRDIDEINATIYDAINNGVYRAGFATSQRAYERGYRRLFEALDELERRLDGRRYLLGPQLTEADWRLFTTLIRFDAVYYGHFKTNRQRIEDFPNLSNYLRELYQYPGVAGTVDFDHIKRHYYYSHDQINPTRVVPLGPEIDYDRPHDRKRFDARR